MTWCLIMLLMGIVRTRLRGKKIILGKGTSVTAFYVKKFIYISTVSNKFIISA